MYAHLTANSAPRCWDFMPKPYFRSIPNDNGAGYYCRAKKAHPSQTLDG